MSKKVFVTVEVIEYPDFNTGYPNNKPKMVARKIKSKMFYDDRPNTISDKDKAILICSDMITELSLTQYIEGSDDE